MLTTSKSDLERSISLITDVQVVDWGRQVVLVGFDDLVTRNQVQLIFRDCRELHWSLYGDEFVRKTEADVIGFCAGKGRHREQAVLTTDLFELAIQYGSVEFRRLSPTSEAIQPLVVR